MANTLVTPETYIRAESDRQFGVVAKMAGGVNRFYHFRRPTPLDKQNVVRIQVFNPKDEDEVALVNKLQDQFIIKANSAEPLPEFKWDLQTLKALTDQYEKSRPNTAVGRESWGPRARWTKRLDILRRLTIYIQNKKPSAGEITNWLPAPEGEFVMTIRAYGPKEELINGDWFPPPVKIGEG